MSRGGRPGPNAWSAAGSSARSGSSRPGRRCTWPPAGRPGRRPQGDPDPSRAWPLAAGPGRDPPGHPGVRTDAPPWAWLGRRRLADRHQRRAWSPWQARNRGRREPGRLRRSRAAWPGESAPARPQAEVQARARHSAVRPAASPARAPASRLAPGARADASPASRSRRPQSRWLSYLVPRANRRHHSIRLHIRTPHPSHSPPTRVRKGVDPQGRWRPASAHRRPPPGSARGWPGGPAPGPGQPDRRPVRRVGSMRLLKHSFERLEIGSNVQVSLFERGSGPASCRGPAGRALPCRRETKTGPIRTGSPFSLSLVS